MVLPADKQVQWFQGQHCYKHGSEELFELTALFILPAGQILLGIMLFWPFYLMAIHYCKNECFAPENHNPSHISCIEIYYAFLPSGIPVLGGRGKGVA